MNSLLRRILVLVLFFISVSLLSGLDTISVIDLNVSSSNPKYEFIGKGLGELISFEIGKSNDPSTYYFHDREISFGGAENIFFSLTP